MDTITLRDLTSYRDALLRRVTGATVKKTVKILRGAWLRAMKDGIIRDNIFIRVDLAEKEVRLITHKTKRPMKIPLHPVLEAHFLNLSPPDDPDAPVFPVAAAAAAVRVGCTKQPVLQHSCGSRTRGRT